MVPTVVHQEKWGVRKTALSAECEARLPLPPAAPSPALSRWVSARVSRTAASPLRAGAAWGPVRVGRRALGAPAETLRPADARRARLRSPTRGTLSPEGVGGGCCTSARQTCLWAGFWPKDRRRECLGEPGAVPGGRAIGERRGGGRVWSEQVAQFRQPGELAGGVGLACQLINFKSQFGSAAA